MSGERFADAPVNFREAPPNPSFFARNPLKSPETAKLEFGKRFGGAGRLSSHSNGVKIAARALMRECENSKFLQTTRSRRGKSVRNSPPTTDDVRSAISCSPSPHREKPP